MKKFICFILIISTLLLLVSCNNADNSSKNDSDESKQETAHVHTFNPATCKDPQTCSTCGETSGTILDHDVVNGECSMCGLDYFDVLRYLIMENFEYKHASSDASSAYFEYPTQNDSFSLGANVSLTVDFRFIEIRYDKIDGDNLNLFVLYIDSASVKNQVYEWEKWPEGFSGDGSTGGRLEAKFFSIATQALDYTHTSCNNSSLTYEQCSDAAKELKIFLNEVLKPLLEKSEHNINLSHFGFDSFE